MTPHRSIVKLWPFVALAGAGWLDFATGPLLPFFPFYVAVLVVVSLRQRWPVAMAFGALAAAILFAVDFVTLPDLRGTIYPYWRAVGHLMSFSLITFTIPRLIEEQRRLVESEAQLMRQRREIHELNTALVKALEDRAGEREHAIQDLVKDHTAEIRNLREVVQQLQVTARRESPPPERRPSPADSARTAPGTAVVNAAPGPLA